MVGILLVSLGWAHPDVPVANEVLSLEAGEARTFPMAVHYHRVVGELDVDGASPDGIQLLLAEAPLWRAEGDAVPMALAEFAAAGEESRVINHLVRCCDAVYTDYRLIVRNDGPSPLTVDLRAWAVHDDFAVVVDRAEAGAFGVPAAIFGALGGLALAFAGRRRRRFRSGLFPSAGSTAPSVRGGAGGSVVLAWSVVLAGIAVTVAGVLGVTGALRYATDPVTGMVAVLADVPVPGGPFGSRAALVMGILLLAWCAAVGTWIRSVASPRGGPVRAVGMGLGVISLAGGIAMGLAYGAVAVPLALGAILGVPLMVAAWWVGPMRGSPSSTQASHGRSTG